MKGDAAGGPIRWRMHLPVAPSRVFDALTTDEGRAAFWAEAAVERDGVVEFRFSNGTTTESRILDRRAPELFVLQYFDGVVRFELTADGQGGTDLLLIHTGVAAWEWHEVHAGWLNVLFPLKAWLVGSLDLRNHDARRSWNHGYADQ